jgi:hypothetical protein
LHSSENDLVPYEQVIDISGLKSALKVLYKSRERRIIEFEEILRNLFVNINRKKVSDNRLKSYKQMEEEIKVNNICKTRPIQGKSLFYLLAIRNTQLQEGNAFTQLQQGAAGAIRPLRHQPVLKHQPGGGHLLAHPVQGPYSGSPDR